MIFTTEIILWIILLVFFLIAIYYVINSSKNIEQLKSDHKLLEEKQNEVLVQMGEIFVIWHKKACKRRVH